ncbi:MAG: hypothetical protein FWD62_05120 [Betaproteobacteria bacterium]|nr:hypothetical protein [Betaproteobacteria bacterium]
MTHRVRRGFALPVFLLAVFGAGIAWVVYTAQLFGGFSQRSQLQTETALRRAREALIQNAVWEDSSPGALLCPDITKGDGTADASCSAGVIGRFPWRTLGIDPPRDGAGECLWYALSGDARKQLHVEWRGQNGTYQAMNPGWSGSMTLHDRVANTNTNVIAVLFAPGPPLPGQARSINNSRCHGGPPAAFLEALDGINNASGTVAVRAEAQAGFNDRVLAITARDLYTAVAPRVLSELAGTDPVYGLRALLSIAPASTWGDEDGNPRIDFTDPMVVAAFPAPAAGQNPAPYPITTNGCTEYVATNDNGNTVSAPGIYSIEWLCFNQWTQYIQFHPDSSDQVTLSMSQSGWQASASPFNSTRLRRIPIE